MKKKRFASYILTGKAAAMPFISHNSFADITPSYTEILSANVSVIELPATGVRLLTTTASTYGGSDAAVCSTTLPSTINVVVTGAHPGNTVYLVASSNKDDGAFSSLSSSVRVGATDFTVISAFTLASNPIQEDASSFTQSTSPISIPVDIAKLKQKNLFTNNKFYLQAVIFSSMDATMWASARLSELDVIDVSTSGCSSAYGGSTY
jgi:hypothetical protein